MARIGGLSTKNAPRPVNAPVGKQSMRLTAEDKNVLLDFVPVVGDVKGAYETVDMISNELEKDEPNYKLIGILGGVGAAATIIGLVPGIGDLAQKAIMAGARSVADSASKLGRGALDLPRQVEVDPDVLGTLGGIDLDKQYATLKEKRDELISQATKDKTFFGDEIYDLDSTMGELSDQINEAGFKPRLENQINESALTPDENFKRLTKQINEAPVSPQRQALKTQYATLKSRQDELISQAMKDQTFFSDEIYNLGFTMSKLSDQMNDMY